MTAPPLVERHVVARVDEIPAGGRLIVEVGGREIGIFNVDGELHAFLHRCPHLGGPLCQGDVLGLVQSDGPGDVRVDAGRKFLVCPWHGWEFDIRTGQSYFDPVRTRARHYPLQVAKGADLHPDADGRVPGPYVATRFPVSIEEDYVVIALRRTGGS